MVKTGLHLDPHLVQDVVRASLIGLHGVDVGCELVSHLVLHVNYPHLTIFAQVPQLGLVAISFAFDGPLDLGGVCFHVLQCVEDVHLQLPHLCVQVLQLLRGAPYVDLGITNTLLLGLFEGLEGRLEDGHLLG